ncbi:MAG: hypothetical protein KC931_10675 [Candidatus Omnitrophica bacterium]|nr:hypothetical protein [Candidatus Omnitrophota bacterium]MCA9442903.1 hypothetical protein [Candidatus Omnitrophota bacterium]MCA9447572.1 hypothetical protein [Candidatus Omnitrophota bacterium]
MTRKTLFVLALAIHGSVIQACIWNSETTSYQEAGLPTLQNVIVGRYERHCDLYH